jgi:hypothetical protein
MANKHYSKVNFRQDVDSILFLKRTFSHDLKPIYFDYFLGKIKFYKRFGGSLEDARDKALMWLSNYLDERNIK